MENKYTEQQKKALREKMNNPEKKVLCPECGTALEYKENGSSCTVECPKGCIRGSVRGI